MKAAGRVEAVRVPDSFPFFTVTDVTEREPQATRSLISVERDTVVAKEPATHATRIELGTTKVFVLPTPSRLRFDASKKLLEPLCGLPAGSMGRHRLQGRYPADTASPIEE